MKQKMTANGMKYSSKIDYLSKSHVKPNFVSILTLDRLSLTKRAVNSILENSVEDVRMIFLDNGSKDFTLEYLDDLKLRYSENVTVLKSECNLGVAAGRNKVIKHILLNYGNQFGWVLNLDNDCLVHKGYDKAITNSIKETGALVVCPRLIQPDGKPFYNSNMGFMIDLNNKKLKLEYTDGEEQPRGNWSSRLETDVILGTSAKTPEFIEKVGFYDEGHKVGWEDFSISLKALGLTKDFFIKLGRKRKDKEGWYPLKKLMNGYNKPLAKIIFEPDCMITHDHPLTEEFKDYEAIRRKATTIKQSTDHFEYVWGLRPVSRRD